MSLQLGPTRMQGRLIGLDLGEPPTDLGGLLPGRPSMLDYDRIILPMVVRLVGC
jgi:hypothetical protein